MYVLLMVVQFVKHFDEAQNLKPVDVVLSKDILRGAGHQSWFSDDFLLIFWLSDYSVMILWLFYDNKKIKKTKKDVLSQALSLGFLIIL